MTKIIKPLKLLIDLKSITDKKILDTDKNLFKHGARKGALGSLTVLAETFDLYLICKYDLDTSEVVRWLKAASLDKSFRKIIYIKEAKPLRDFILQTGINVTIATDAEIIEAVKETSETYWLSNIHTKDIQSGILKINSWYDVLKNVIKYSTRENYDFRYIKKKY